MFKLNLEEEIESRLDAVISLTTGNIFNPIIGQGPLYVLPRHIDKVSTPCINTIKGILPIALGICSQRYPAK